jgi:hypothetical protein
MNGHRRNRSVCFERAMNVHFIEAAKFKAASSEPDEGLLITLDGVSAEGSELLANLERGLILSAIVPSH